MIVWRAGLIGDDWYLKIQQGFQHAKFTKYEWEETTVFGTPI